MLPILQGKIPPPVRPWYSYIDQNEKNPSASVIEDDWKLVARSGNPLAAKPGKQTRYELYNLAKDPSETQNLAEKNPDMVKKLTTRLAEFGRLQPDKQGVARYSEGKADFTAPKDWIINDD
jgi:arylsulfatase A-like enzyme